MTRYRADPVDAKLVTKVTYPDDGTILSTYYADGTQHTKTDQRGWMTTFMRDNMGRVVREEVQATGGNPVTGTTLMTYSYDALGRTVLSTDNNDPADVHDDSQTQTQGQSPRFAPTFSWRHAALRGAPPRARKDCPRCSRPGITMLPILVMIISVSWRARRVKRKSRSRYDAASLLPLLLAIELIRDGIRVAVEDGFHLVAAVHEDGEHRLVGREHLREEPLHAALLGDRADVAQEVAAHAFVLPFVLHDEGYFGGVVFRVEEVLGDGHDVLAVGAIKAEDDACEAGCRML